MATSLPGAIPPIPEINLNSMAAPNTHSSTFYTIWNEFRELCSLVFSLRTRIAALESATRYYVVTGVPAGTVRLIDANQMPFLRSCWARGVGTAGKVVVVPLTATGVFDSNANYFWSVTTPEGQNGWTIYLTGRPS